MADGSGTTIGGVDFFVRADTSQVGRELVRTEQRARNTANTMVREFDKADRSADRLATSLKRSTSTLALFGAGFTGAALVKGLVDAADTMNLLRGRISNVITEGENLNRVMKDLYNASQNNRSSLEGTATLYLRLRNSIKDLNHETALQLSSTFAQTLVLSGASAQEAASSMLQFSQAMGSGRLQGDELRSLLENNTRFAKGLAAALGVTVGELKALGEAGALTSELVANATKEMSTSVSAEFANVPLTIGQAFQQLQNGLLQYVGQVDSSFGVSERVAKGIQLLTANIEELGNALLIIGAGVASAGAGFGLKALVGGGGGSFVASIVTALNSFNANTDKGKAVQGLENIRAKLADVRQEAGFANASVLAMRATVQAMEANPLTNVDQLALARGQLRENEHEAARLLLTQQRLERQAVTGAGRMSQAFSGFGATLKQVGQVGGQVFSSLINFLGGPLGVAILAASAAMSYFVAKSLEYERATRSIQSGLEIVAGLNISVSKAAAEAAGKTDELTTATDAQKKAVDALNVAKKEQLRIDLRQAILDADKRKRDLEALAQSGRNAQNAIGVTDYGKRFIQENTIDPAAKEAKRLGESMQIMADGLTAIDNGMANLSESANDTRTDVEKAVAAFREVVALQRRATTPDKFKSAAVKGAIGKLAETDLAAARAEFGSVRDLLNDQDAAAVEKNFRTIGRATMELKGALTEFSTDAEKFKKAISDIAKADPSEGNKSRAAVAAILDYGKELENIPAAFKAIQDSKLLNPKDAETAKAELRKIAEEGGRAFGTDAQQAMSNFASALKEINDAEKALQATGAAYDPGQFASARAILTQELADAVRTFPAEDFAEVADLIRDMMTPAEKLKEELADIAAIRANEADGSLGAQAADRKRIDLLEDEARAAGLAKQALADLELLRGSAGYSDGEIRQKRREILAAASDGRKGKRPEELSADQWMEEARFQLTDALSTAFVQAIRSGDVGEAVMDVFTNKVADALSDAISQIAEQVVNLFLGDNGIFTQMGSNGGSFDIFSAIGSLFGSPMPKAAHGGKGYAGTPMIVGETGKREVFIPGADGYVVPASALDGSAARGYSSRRPTAVSVRGGDVIVQGDASENTLRLIRMENARNAKELERAMGMAINEKRRRN